MAWKVLDIIIDGVMKIQGITVDVSDSGKVMIDGKNVPLLGEGDFSNKDLQTDSAGNLIPVLKMYGTGDTASIPTSPPDGFQYFNTDLKKPQWFYSGSWYDASGNIV